MKNEEEKVEEKSWKIVDNKVEEKLRQRRRKSWEKLEKKLRKSWKKLKKGLTKSRKKSRKIFEILLKKHCQRHNGPRVLNSKLE